KLHKENFSDLAGRVEQAQRALNYAQKDLRRGSLRDAEYWRVRLGKLCSGFLQQRTL
ncbi:hypothetical protein Dimus_018045, partial [Dionaea muscipula]